jgi:hypothetical protein
MVDFTGTGLPLIDWGEIFHVGVRVADLEKAQQELTTMTGGHWTKPATLPMNAWDPSAGARQKSEITISFSVEGPTPPTPASSRTSSRVTTSPDQPRPE